jgi:hypothetical protein
MVNKAIVLVRNPFDSIVSFWNLMAGSSHTASLPTELFTTFADLWEKFIEHETQIWIGFHKFWLEAATKKIPILLVRYEDILANRDDVTRQMIDFMGETRAPVECLVEKSRTATLYKPRNKTNEGKAEQWFPQKERDAMRSVLRERLCAFGYEKDMELDCKGVTPLIRLTGTNEAGKVSAESCSSRELQHGVYMVSGSQPESSSESDDGLEHQQAHRLLGSRPTLTSHSPPNDYHYSSILMTVVVWRHCRHLGVPLSSTTGRTRPH